MKRKLEIACFNLESAIIAETNGASRIELCENYNEGGISPSESLIKTVLEKTNIPVFVMIRPRPGNFCYSENEIELMKKQILFCKTNNCDGVVFGILTPDKNINVSACTELVNLAKPLPSTFHRAFDEISDSETALENIITCGFKRILTSGGAITALDGKEKLQRLIEIADERIIIVPGGGIRSSNIAEITTITHASEFHSAAIIDHTDLANADEIQLLSNTNI